MRTTLLIAHPYDAAATRELPQLPGMTTAQAWPGSPTIDVTGGETDVHLADRDYRTEPDDAPQNVLFAGRLQPALTRSLVLWDAGQAEPAGNSRASVGDIVIANGDGDYDDLIDYGWDGRSVEVLTGEHDDAIADFTTVLVGTVDRIRFDPGAITLRNRDPGAVMDEPLERSRYAGTGGAEGDSDLENVSRPYLAGRCRNVTPVVVSRADNLFQFHDGPLKAIDTLRDRGIALTLAGDYASVAELLAASTGADGSGADIEASEYATCLAQGCARAGTDPTGLVTGDAEGDNANGYVSTTATIVRQIVTSRIGAFSLRDPEDLDTATFTALDTDQPGTVGLYVREEGATLRQALATLLAPVGGWWYLTRAGLFAVGHLKAPDSPSATLTDRHILRLERLDMPMPSWRRRLGWRRAWTVQSEEDLAGAVPDGDKQFLSNEYRYAEDSDSAIKGKHRYAREVVLATLFDDEADASAETARQQALHSPDRDRYRVTLSAKLYEYYVNQVLALKYLRAAARQRLARSGGAMQFDGDELQRVVVPYDSAFDLADALTVECLVKLRSGGDPKQGFIEKAVGTGTNTHYLLFFENNRIGWRCRTFSGSLVTIYSNTDLRDDIPHRIAGIYNGTDMIGYLDGVEFDRIPVGGLNSGDGELWFGRLVSASTYDMDGVLDDVRIWNIARTQAEIQADMHQALDVDAVTRFLKLPGGAGDTATTPHAARFNVTDLQFVAVLAPGDWASGVGQDLVVKGAGTDYSFGLQLQANGKLKLTWSEDGTTPLTVTSAAAVSGTNGESLALRVSLDTDDGAGGLSVTFEQSGNYDADRLEGDWVEIGAPATGGGTTSIHQGSSDIVLGDQDTIGRLYRFQLFGEIDGGIIADFNPMRAAKGDASFEADTGETWTVNGGAAIDNGLAGYWKLDDGGGVTAADSSGNGNDGTLVNDPQWVDPLVYDYSEEAVAADYLVNKDVTVVGLSEDSERGETVLEVWG